MEWLVRSKQFVATTKDGQEFAHDITIRQHDCGAYLTSHPLMRLSIAESFFRERDVLEDVAVKMTEAANSKAKEVNRLCTSATKKMFAGAGINGLLNHELNRLSKSGDIPVPYQKNFDDFRKVLDLLSSGVLKVVKAE